MVPHPRCGQIVCRHRISCVASVGLTSTTGGMSHTLPIGPGGKWVYASQRSEATTTRTGRPDGSDDSSATRMNSPPVARRLRGSTRNRTTGIARIRPASPRAASATAFRNERRPDVVSLCLPTLLCTHRRCVAGSVWACYVPMSTLSRHCRDQRAASESWRRDVRRLTGISLLPDPFFDRRGCRMWHVAPG